MAAISWTARCPKARNFARTESYDDEPYPRRQAHVSRESKTVLLGASDSVAVAITDIAAGDEIGGGLIALTDIPSGHKVAVTAIGAGDTGLKYGQAIGIATAAIAKGAHVHSH